MGELTSTTLVLFVMFAAVLVVMYVVTRRGLAPIGIVALVGTVVNIILVALISAASGNNPLHVIIVGVAIGLIFSMASVAMAAYFRSSEMQPAGGADAKSAVEMGSDSIEG